MSLVVHSTDVIYKIPVTSRKRYDVVAFGSSGLDKELEHDLPEDARIIILISQMIPPEKSRPEMVREIY